MGVQIHQWSTRDIGESPRLRPPPLVIFQIFLKGLQDMKTVTVTLQKGVIFGGKRHLDAEIRQYTGDELSEAFEESQIDFGSPTEGSRLVTSPSRLCFNLLRRQLIRIGDHQGPFSMDDIKRLSARDLRQLMVANYQLGKTLH